MGAGLRAQERQARLQAVLSRRPGRERQEGSRSAVGSGWEILVPVGPAGAEPEGGLALGIRQSGRAGGGEKDQHPVAADVGWARGRRVSSASDHTAVCLLNSLPSCLCFHKHLKNVITLFLQKEKAIYRPLYNRNSNFCV